MTKNSLGNIESLFNVNSPFCIEISLRTPENQTMILETWCILFNDQLADPSQKVCYSVYKKMSHVLRSLMCNTRCTPTYQLSRRQSSDTYVLLYKMYTGEPIVHHLGENYATAKVGTVGTPIGSIIVNLAYRTRLTMSPQNSAHPNEAASGGIQIKDDHFNTEIRQMSELQVNEINPDYHLSNYKNIQSEGALSTNQTQFVSPTKSPTKSQPIPMKKKTQPIRLNQIPDSQRNSSEQNDDENSTDEYNSSSIASTPDTMYYFKLKTAAFVHSASFNNNCYSTSLGNISQEQEQLPFMHLMTNNENNNTTSINIAKQRVCPNSGL